MISNRRRAAQEDNISSSRIRVLQYGVVDIARGQRVVGIVLAGEAPLDLKCFVPARVEDNPG